MKELKVRIYVDVREERSSIPKILEKEGALVIRRRLDVGDYLVSEDSVVERKSVGDFASSLFDGRLFDQAKRLREVYNNVYYIIEGNIKKIVYRWNNRLKQFSSAMITLATVFDAKILWSVNEENTAYIILALARNLQSHEGRTHIVIHKKPRLSSIEEWQLYVVQSFPGIGPRLAESILNEFKTVEKFCNASLTELSRISGLGERRAELIKRILKTPFKPLVNKKRQSLEDFLNK